MQIAKKDVAEFPTYSKLSKAVSSEADTHKRPQKQRLFLPVQKAVGQKPAHRFVVQFQTEVSQYHGTCDERQGAGQGLREGEVFVLDPGVVEVDERVVHHVQRVRNVPQEFADPGRHPVRRLSRSPEKDEQRKENHGAQGVVQPVHPQMFASPRCAARTAAPRPPARISRTHPEYEQVGTHVKAAARPRRRTADAGNRRGVPRRRTPPARSGRYLVAEANIESHGMGYDEKTLAKNPAFARAHLERNIRNVRRNINHPSVIVWSLGNEAGDGPNFDACYDWVKAYDPTRPVHYERAVYNNGGRNTDIVCPMYWNYDQCEKYLRKNPRKPLIQSEYTHAMGNSLGGFREYWELIRKYPHYQGGFIWDFVNQSLHKTGKNGAMIYGYGGDWNPYDASDWNFCDNGLISPDRVPNPHMHEARYWQQPVWTTLGGDRRTLTVFNENFFRPLDNCYLRWTVLRDGEPVRSGIVADLRVAPQQSATVVLPYDPAQLPAGGELLLNVEYRLCDAEHRADRHNSIGTLAIRDNDRNYLIVESPAARIDFRRADGLVTRYEANGMRLLDEGAVVEPNFWRAPTDNDFGAKLNEKNRAWADPGLTLLSLDHTLTDGVAVVTARYDLQHVTGRLEIEYRIDNAGEMLIRQTLHAAADKGEPDLMRFGMRMRLPAAYDRIDYYGRGPWENYADRKDGALLGHYRQTVDEQFYPYIRPQETGTKSDVRRWRQCDIAGRGVEIAAEAPFSASALHYAQETLDEGLTKKQGHSQEVEPDPAVWLCIDKAQYGLGCIDSWGQLPLPQYRLPYKDYEFEFKIAPLE